MCVCADKVCTVDFVCVCVTKAPRTSALRSTDKGTCKALPQLSMRSWKPIHVSKWGHNLYQQVVSWLLRLYEIWLTIWQVRCGVKISLDRGAITVSVALAWRSRTVLVQFTSASCFVFTNNIIWLWRLWMSKPWFPSVQPEVVAGGSLSLHHLDTGQVQISNLSSNKLNDHSTWLYINMVDFTQFMLRNSWGNPMVGRWSPKMLERISFPMNMIGNVG